MTSTCVHVLKPNLTLTHSQPFKPLNHAFRKKVPSFQHHQQPMTSNCCESSYLFLTQSRDFRLQLVKLFLQICVLWQTANICITMTYLWTDNFRTADLWFNKILSSPSVRNKFKFSNKTIRSCLKSGVINDIYLWILLHLGDKFLWQQKRRKGFPVKT